MNQIDHLIANECAASVSQVAAVRALFADGGTVPFIARYRKERTGNLDETVLREIRAAEQRLTQLEERRRAIRANLEKRALLNPELEAAIASAVTRTELEDIYLPYKQRTKTRADRAREAGLQPLADALLTDTSGRPREIVQRLCPPELSVTQAEAGARDILAETLSVDPELRTRLRRLFVDQGALASTRARKRGTPGDRGRSSGVDTPKPRHGAETYRDYEQWREPARRAPSHRVLAILRGAEEGHLSVSLKPPEAGALRIITEHLYRRATAHHGRETIFQTVALDAWKRLLAPSLEREAITAVRTRAVTEARGVFQKNLAALLLTPPYGARPVLALDPGIRTGCKVACLGAGGEVLEVGVIYPLPPHGRHAESVDLLARMCRDHAVSIIAVGDGTGGRETEQFVRDAGVTGEEGLRLPVISVHEAGASVYSASEYAREELPDLDVQYRGAVSIGRRLQDPLAELVKVDPASIGVGQYQHDLDGLDEALSGTVESCVNRVGVDVNTASVPLLARVAGMTRRTAAAVVAERERGGLFSRRMEVARVPGVGPKTVEQAVGFLRCPQADNPLENTGVHPERYPLVETLAADCGVSVRELAGNEELLNRVDPLTYVDEGTQIGRPTVEDILAELRRPGRDPRPVFHPPEFDQTVTDVSDLKTGMELNGVVRNVVAFGAFVDIGVHRDGLVHVSEIAAEFVRDPSSVLQPGQQVRVRVMSVEEDRRRINLSMRRVGEPIETGGD